MGLGRMDRPAAPGRVEGRIPHRRRAEEVVVADSTSVNLFKCIVAAADINRPRSLIVTERGEFPTDVYVAEGVEQATDGRLRTIDRANRRLSPRASTATRRPWS